MSTARPSDPGPPATTVEVVLDRLTLEQRIRQLLIIHLYGDRPQLDDGPQAAANIALYGAASPGEVVARHEVGGVIFLGRNEQDPDHPELPTQNVENAALLPTLVDGLQEAAVGATGIPLLLAVDQEQGSISRIGRPVTRFPGAAALAASGSTRLARQAAAATGHELAALGIRWNLAPIADVNLEPRNPVIGLRSFGDDAALVRDLVGAQVAGYQQDAGIVATVKHFPGHGDTTTDSHHSLPVIGHDEATVRGIDLAPFAAAVEAGVEAVMPGHLLVPAFDDVPATFSRRLLQGLLREELGFPGVVVTDGLFMRAVRGRVDNAAELGVRALQAGVDALLMPPAVDATVRHIREAVVAGDLAAERVDEACRRVLALKQRQGLLASGWRPAARLPDASRVREHRRLEDRIAARAVTRLGVAGPRMAPLAGPTLVVGPPGPTTTLADALGAAAMIIDDEPSDTAVERAVTAAHHVAEVVFLERGDQGHAGQRALVSALARAGRRVITTSIGLPTDARVTGADLTLVVYDDGTAAMRGLAHALVAAEFPGRLPFALPGA